MDEQVSDRLGHEARIGFNNSTGRWDFGLFCRSSGLVQAVGDDIERRLWIAPLRGWPIAPPPCTSSESRGRRKLGLSPSALHFLDRLAAVSEAA